MKHVLWRTSVRDEVDAELAFHVEMTIRELMETGMTEHEARAKAGRRLGDAGSVSETCRRYGNERDRRARRSQYRDELRQDLSFAWRQLARAPGFAGVAIATLALSRRGRDGRGVQRPQRGRSPTAPLPAFGAHRRDIADRPRHRGQSAPGS